jgi:hypothetical protein
MYASSSIVQLSLDEKMYANIETSGNAVLRRHTREVARNKKITRSKIGGADAPSADTMPL